MEKYIKICEALGWSCDYDEDDGNVYIRQYSPAGEDFGFDVDADDFVENVKAFAENFDPEENVLMWVEAKVSGRKLGVPSVKELVEDADAIKAMLEALAEALEQGDVPEPPATKKVWFRAGVTVRLTSDEFLDLYCGDEATAKGVLMSKLNSNDFQWDGDTYSPETTGSLDEWSHSEMSFCLAPEGPAQW